MTAVRAAVVIAAATAVVTGAAGADAMTTAADAADIARDGRFNETQMNTEKHR